MIAYTVWVILYGPKINVILRNYFQILNHDAYEMSENGYEGVSFDVICIFSEVQNLRILFSYSNR